ncbi:MAG: CinA family protein, partial [Victivallales bacterium]|nr:CinA family protein [Victivallales bacterium]
EVFKGGFIVYSNELKMKLLDIPGELLEHVGAVSAECAEALVENLCRELDADAGIAVTGVAGPGGGTPEKPVGLVYAGIRFNGKTAVRKFQFPGDRARVRERTLHSSVNALLSMIRG